MTGTERPTRLSSVAIAVASAGLAFASPARAQDDPPPPELPADTPASVVVRGDRADTLKRASGSSSIVSEREIKRAQPESSAEMLRRVPGLQIRQEDATGLRLNVGVRGLSPTRSRLVLVEEDGVPVVVSPYGEPELYYSTALERIQRINVIKGSDVLLHGPQTVGAVLDIHTWAPTEQPSWYVAGTAGSRGFGEGIARYSDTYRDVGYVVQALHKGGAGYRDMGFSVTDAFGKVRFSTGRDGELTLKLAFHDELARTTYTGLTDALYRAAPRRDTIAPDDHFGIRRSEVSLRHTQRIGDGTELRTAVFAYQMDTGLRLQDFDRTRGIGVTYARIADPAGLYFRPTTSIRDRVYDVAGVSTEVQSRFATGPVVHKVTGGGRFMADVARRRLSRGSFPRAESGDLLTDDTTTVYGFAGWLQDQIALTDALVVTPAIRAEHSRSEKTTHRFVDVTTPRDVDLTGSTHSTGVMPGLGLVLGTPRLNVFASEHIGYSAPRISQAITPDGRDASLKAEHSTNYEVGVRGRLGEWLRADAAGFLVNFDNQLVSNNPLSGSTSEFVNGGRTRHLGVESSAFVHAGAFLALPLVVDLGAHYTFVRSRFVGGTFDGNAIPYAPAHTATGTLDVGHAIGLSGQVALSYVGAQFTDEKNTLEAGPTGLDGRMDPYAVLDVGARYLHAKSGLSLSVAVKNALDRVYISNRLPNGIFTSGFRQVYLTLAWTTPG